MKKILKLFPADENFAKLFSVEKTRLEKILSPEISIEHVGSTAVPGLGGKGLVDIAVGVKDISDVQPTAEILIRNGYYVDRRKERPSDRIILSSYERTVTSGEYALGDNNIIVIVKDGKIWQDGILFRDRLRESKKLRDEYMSLKERAFVESGEDREKYKQLKKDFIGEAIRGQPED